MENGNSGNHLGDNRRVVKLAKVNKIEACYGTAA